MARLAALLALLLALSAAGDVEAAPRWRCKISGVVLLDGKPAAATVTVKRYAGVEAIRHFAERMPGHEEVTVPEGEGTQGTRSDARGRYRFDALPPGCYAVVATDDKGHISEEVIACHADGMHRELRLALRESHSLAGTLTWSDGKPLRGRVVLSAGRSIGRAGSGPYNPWSHATDELPRGPERATEIDASGSFRFAALPSFRHRILIEATNGVELHGYESLPLASASLSWSVERQSLVASGLLVDADTRKPIDGALVTCHQFAAPKPTITTRGKTGTDGRFSIPVGSRAVTLRVQAQGYEHFSGPLPKSGSILALKPLPRVSKVSGRVVRADGSAVAGARVVVGTQERRHASFFETTTSAADGTFAVEGVPAGERVVFVRGGGFASVGLADATEHGHNAFVLPEGAGSKRVVRVQAAARITGTFVDPAGKPVEGALVRALGTRRARSSRPFVSQALNQACVGPAVVTTDGAGRFVLDELVPGLLYEILLTAPGLPPTRTGPHPAIATTTDLRIQAPRPRWLDITVLDSASGEPLPGASASLYLEDVRPRWLYPPSAISGKDGRISFGPLGAGSPSFYLHRKGYMQQHVQVTDKEVDGRIAHTARLVRALQIHGRIKGPGKSPRDPVYVRVRFADSKHHAGMAASDAEGSFHVDGLAPGAYEIGLHRDPSSEPGAWRPVAAGAKDVVLELTASDVQPIRLKVRVLGPNGEQVARAHVTVEARRRSTGAHAADGVAVFELDAGLFEAGAVRVVVTDAQDESGEPLPYGRTVAGPIARDAGEITVRLMRERVILGRIVDSEGAGVGGAGVDVRLDTGDRSRRVHIGAVRADGEGRFRVGQLGRGTHTLTVRAGPDFVPPDEIDVTEGAGEISITLERGVTATLTIVDYEDKPVVGARIRARPASRRMSRRDGVRRRRRAGGGGQSAADGSVVLRGLPEGQPFRLEVTRPSAREDLQSLEIGEWMPKDEVLRLARGMLIAGEVRLSTGELAENAQVQVRSEHMVGGFGGRGGRFHRSGLEPGSYTLTARRRDSKYAWGDERLPSITVTKDTRDIVLVLPEE